ncbi:centrosomal protein 15 [Gadus morhua]|uniref:centrosomal protein 15 n=1 Tax=Gadus morhua TaxID=8049 RepID=UPI0011B77FC4|nr:uncharacterized protein C3orf14 homolog [Gadus morhua]
MERNRRLLEDVRKTEELLSKSQMTDPHLLSLETQYWVSVEAQIPTWQGSLLGTAPGPGPALGPDPARPPRKAQQRSAAAKDPSRPPLPRPRGPL